MASSVPEIAHFMDNNANFVKAYGTPPTMTQIRAQGLKEPNGGALIIRKSQPFTSLLSSPLSTMHLPQFQHEKPVSLYQEKSASIYLYSHSHFKPNPLFLSLQPNPRAYV